MKNKTLIAMVAAGALLISCTKQKPIPESYVSVEVVKVYNNLHETRFENSPEWDGVFSYSNETAKLSNPSFVFDARTIQGGDTIIYTVGITLRDNDDIDGSPGPQDVWNLEHRIKPGVKVSFPTQYKRGCDCSIPLLGFSSSNIGKIDPDDLKIIK